VASSACSSSGSPGLQSREDPAAASRRTLQKESERQQGSQCQVQLPNTMCMAAAHTAATVPDAAAVPM
jgi:hypothetical protein